MTKQDNTTLWVIGIVIFLFLILPHIQQQKQDEGLIGLTVHYYKNGGEVFPEKGFLGFSIVTPPGGSFDQISISISGTASGVSYSNIKIVSATPTAFSTALPTTIQSLAASQTKTLWTSGLMDTIQFETMAQPVRFFVDVSAVSGYTGEIEHSLGYRDLNIKSEVVSGGSRSVSLFSIVSPDATEYSITCPGNAWVDIHNYGSVTTSSPLSLIDSFTAKADLWTGPDGRPQYRFKIVGDNTARVQSTAGGGPSETNTYYSSYRAPYYEPYGTRVGNVYVSVGDWRENVKNVVGDTSYSVILQGMNSGTSSSGTCKVKNMNLGVIYLQ